MLTCLSVNCDDYKICACMTSHIFTFSDKDENQLLINKHINLIIAQN